ncbi:MAG: FAD-dependent oxidoreductase [Methylobacterium sp.]|nr:FAD-dependent oxidoreductase [Methylobacterium sp.]
MGQDLTRVAVIGGGCAGLAAAAELAVNGIPVTLLEAAKQVGGRARGLNWKGRRLDNGQHILLGAYRETLRLMRLAGVDTAQALLRLPLQLVQHPGFELRASPHLPAPLHVLAGLLRAKGLAPRERLAALAFMARLKLSGFRIRRDQPLAIYLRRHRQSEALVRWLWEPICLAALNTPLEQASTRVFLNVLRDSFAGAKSDSDLLLPRLDLSALLAEPLARLVKRCGGEVQTGTTVSAIRSDGDGFRLACAEAILPFSHVIVAASPFRLNDLLRDLPLAPVPEPGYQPIATIYLQYPDGVSLPFPMVGLTGGYSQWVLDRGALDGQPGLLGVVISAEGRHQALTQEALATAVAQELAAAFPGLPPPEWHKVIVEKRATFSCTPDLLRPQQKTPLKNLFIAGDFSAGDYPATIEGAVRSGVQCARLISASLGRS